MLTVSSFPLRTGRRPQTYAVLKSLVNTDTAAPTETGQLPGQEESSGQIVINFPCLPDTIELARRANYQNVLPTPVTPDGLHLYQHTEPLQIPLSFSLHGYDSDYCGPAGPLMLLSVAAKLHALTMPIHKGGVLNLLPVAAPTEDKKAGETKSDPAEMAKVTENSTPINGALFQNPTGFDRGQQTGVQFAYPPPCALNIMLAQIGASYGSVNQSNDGLRSLGINCIGFVSDVRVVFNGPWLQGSFGEDGIRNMPSSADFSFTFVHAPGHTNFIGDFGLGASLLTTTARDIYQRLYNTADLQLERAPVQFSDLNSFGP